MKKIKEYPTSFLCIFISFYVLAFNSNCRKSIPPEKDNLEKQETAKADTEAQETAKADTEALEKIEEEAADEIRKVMQRIERYKRHIKVVKKLLTKLDEESEEFDREAVKKAVETMTKDSEEILTSLGLTASQLEKIASQDGNPSLSSEEVEDLKKLIKNKEFTKEQTEEFKLLQAHTDLFKRVRDKLQAREKQEKAKEKAKEKVTEISFGSDVAKVQNKALEQQQEQFETVMWWQYITAGVGFVFIALSVVATLLIL